MADAPEANASSPKRPSADGGPLPFWRRCVAAGSPRPALSTDRSMARASTLMSSKFSCPSSRRATLSSWTTSAAIRAAPFAQRSAPPRPTLLPARLLARPQSNRTSLRQNEDLAAQGRRTNHRRDLANHRRPARLLHPERMRKLLQKRRIRFSLTRSRFRAKGATYRDLGAGWGPARTRRGGQLSIGRIWGPNGIWRVLGMAELMRWASGSISIMICRSASGWAQRGRQ